MVWGRGGKADISPSSLPSLITTSCTSDTLKIQAAAKPWNTSGAELFTLHQDCSLCPLSALWRDIQSQLYPPVFYDACKAREFPLPVPATLPHPPQHNSENVNFSPPISVYFVQYRALFEYFHFHQKLHCGCSVLRKTWVPVLYFLIPWLPLKKVLVWCQEASV